jgi:hypothetical protein
MLHCLPKRKMGRGAPLVDKVSKAVVTAVMSVPPVILHWLFAPILLDVPIFIQP